MATRISNAARSGAASGAVDLLDAGSGPGHIEIRTGTQPATVATAATGTLLGTVTLADPAFGDAVNGVATASTITGDTAVATGTAGWFRAYDSDDNAVIDGACGESGSGAEMILSEADVILGGEINVTSWTVTMPAG